MTTAYPYKYDKRGKRAQTYAEMARKLAAIRDLLEAQWRVPHENESVIADRAVSVLEQIDGMIP